VVGARLFGVDGFGCRRMGRDTEQTDGEGQEKGQAKRPGGMLSEVCVLVSPGQPEYAGPGSGSLSQGTSIHFVSGQQTDQSPNFGLAENTPLFPASDFARIAGRRFSDARARSAKL
jgi:hypothetical protein